MTVNYEKIIQALNYFASLQEEGKIEKIKAYKLLWLADRYQLRQYGMLISNDTYHALPHGPVPSKTKMLLDGINKDVSDFSDNIEIIDKNLYKSITQPNMKVFSKLEKNTLSKIYKTFGGKSSAEISNFSHQFPEWKRFEPLIKDMTKKKSHKMNIMDFFEDVDEDSKLFLDDTELISITRQLYKELY